MSLREENVCKVSVMPTHAPAQYVNYAPTALMRSVIEEVAVRIPEWARVYDALRHEWNRVYSETGQPPKYMLVGARWFLALQSTGHAFTPDKVFECQVILDSSMERGVRSIMDTALECDLWVHRKCNVNRAASGEVCELAKCREDSGSRAVIADWLEENGRSADANAVRAVDAGMKVLDELAGDDA